VNGKRLVKGLLVKVSQGQWLVVCTLADRGGQAQVSCLLQQRRDFDFDREEFISVCPNWWSALEVLCVMTMD
jgi:hypothetical protein